MRKSLTSTSVLCLMTLSLSSIMPLQAGGCSSHKNKKVEIECKTNDTECINNKAKKNLQNFDA